TPDRSCVSNGWPSTLYFASISILSLLFSQRGHFFQPSGGGTEDWPWAKPPTEKASAATKTPKKTKACFRIYFSFTTNYFITSPGREWGSILTHREVS